MLGDESDDDKIVAEGKDEERGVHDPHHERTEISDVKEEMEQRREELHLDSEGAMPSDRML